MLLTHRGRVFLGKRQVFPQKDWWVGCGGRMKPGESVFEASRRLLQREVKLTFEVADLKRRLQTVGSYSFVWGKREQAPQTNGTADISVVVTMELTESEVAALVPDEFEVREWIPVYDILAGDFHPALKRAVQDYVQLQKLKVGNEPTPRVRGRPGSTLIIVTHTLVSWLASSPFSLFLSPFCRSWMPSSSVAPA